jgi:hypothetical protein
MDKHILDMDEFVGLSKTIKELIELGVIRTTVVERYVRKKPIEKTFMEKINLYGFWHKVMLKTSLLKL